MRPPYPDETVKAAVNDYLNGDDLQEVSERYGMSKSSVTRMLKRAGHKTRSISDARRVYSIDATFFQRIDTHKKAQILGFIYADGCLQIKSPTSGYLAINISPDDTAYLEWIKDSTKSDRPLRHYDYVTKEEDRKRTVLFTTSQPEIVRDLQRLGVSPRKSLTIRFPTPEQVPIEFVGSFIRGYFEGDGCIHLQANRGGPTLRPQITLIGSTAFIETLSARLSAYGIKCSVTAKTTLDQQNAYALLHVNTVSDVMRFYDLIYANAPYKMERKHAKFLQFKAQYREETIDGIKTYQLINRSKFCRKLPISREQSPVLV